MARLRRRRRIRIHPLLVLLLIIALLGGIIEYNLRRTIMVLAETEARWVANRAIQEAVLEQLATETSYQDIIRLERDNQQRVVFMQADIVKINRLASSATLEIQQALEAMRSQTFYIPFGQVLGSQLLAHYGPRIKLIIVPVGSVQPQIIDRFEEAGINSTRHRIYLHVATTVRVVIPLISSEVVVSSQIPIADSIIVGPVPDTYMKLNQDTLPSAWWFGSGIQERILPPQPRG